MPLDPLLKNFLDQFYAQPGPKICDMQPREARDTFAMLMQFIGPQTIRWRRKS